MPRWRPCCLLIRARIGIFGSVAKLMAWKMWRRMRGSATGQRELGTNSVGKGQRNFAVCFGLCVCACVSWSPNCFISEGTREEQSRELSTRPRRNKTKVPLSKNWPSSLAPTWDAFRIFTSERRCSESVGGSLRKQAPVGERHRLVVLRSHLLCSVHELVERKLVRSVKTSHL